MLKQKCTIAWASCNISPPSTENSRKFSHLPLPPLQWSRRRITLSVLDLTFAETVALDTPLLRILTTIKKPSSYLTMSILISADFRFVTKNVGNTMYSRGNTEIKLWLFVVVSDELNSLVKCRRRKSNYPPHLGLLMKRS